MKKVYVVYKKSTFELYSNSPDKEIQGYMAKNAEDVAELRKSHEAQKKTLDLVVSELERKGITTEVMYRAELAGQRTLEADLVVSVGGDGTVLEVARYVGDLPLLGVNSDPASSVGYFCYTNRAGFAQVLENYDSMPHTKLSRLELELNGKKIPELVLNDTLIAHTNPAAVTRYKLWAEDYEEKGKGSGLLVCTAAGSTAFMFEEGGAVMPLDSDEMQFVQRGRRGKKFRFAKELRVRSYTRQGRLYVDGAHMTYDFTLGDELIIRMGKKLDLVGDLNEKRKNYAD